MNVGIWQTEAGWFYRVTDDNERVVVSARGPLTFEAVWLQAREAAEAGPVSNTPHDQAVADGPEEA